MIIEPTIRKIVTRETNHESTFLRSLTFFVKCLPQRLGGLRDERQHPRRDHETIHHQSSSGQLFSKF